MAVPKRKVSKARRDQRRTHYKARIVATVTCPQCGEAKRPHYVCPNCGYYAGKKVSGGDD